MNEEMEQVIRNAIKKQWDTYYNNPKSRVMDNINELIIEAIKAYDEVKKEDAKNDPEIETKAILKRQIKFLIDWNEKLTTSDEFIATNDQIIQIRENIKLISDLVDQLEEFDNVVNVND